MKYEQLKEKARLLPLLPGVYLMKDQSGTIIYVGKAKALRNRVGQYFVPSDQHSLKTRRMIAQIRDFDVMYAGSELEALLLENTLIKKYMPKYNILLKDDKGYPFIRLENGEYPRFSVASRRERDSAEYFGPYGGRGAANTAIRIITETFSMPNCSRHFPRDIGKERPCLRAHLQKCCAVCTGNVTPDEYRALLEQACMLLEGKCQGLLTDLNEQMSRRADALDFEGAAAIRDRIRAVEGLRQTQLVTGFTGADADVLAFETKGARSCVTILSFKEGSLCGKQTVFFDGLEQTDGADALDSVLKQHYSLIGSAPVRVYISVQPEEQEALEQFLTTLSGRKVYLTSPKRGESKKWVSLALENAAQELLALEKREEKSMRALEGLAEMLELPERLERIEAYDISNTAGSEPVAAMTVYADGRPVKRSWRRFTVKTAEGGDDYGAITEVIGRRLDRAISGDENFLPLPTLILVDGGAGQVRAALKALEARTCCIPVWGMVKDDRHRTRALVNQENAEIGIGAIPSVFALVGRIQEDTHRHAVEYHQGRRGKMITSSTLDQIPGVGEQRKQKLLSHFGSVSAIRAATEQQLQALVPQPVVRNIKEYFERRENT